ncbi:hypothetical protein LMH87_011840 [Akanthomyces muscarius]|nr:hypothetical protein LMH87_011840 [Akanthomyces muscarius]KAJ4151124.1 hypothetical protein LMH87_011840 [Akanthomyces muscarius]
MQRQLEPLRLTPAGTSSALCPRASEPAPVAYTHTRRSTTIMPRAIRSVLIECDPSIKSIIVNIDSENHDFIIEDLDEERVVVKENMVPLLKQKLEDRLKENLPPVDESGSE